MKWIIRIFCLFIVSPINSLLTLFIPASDGSINSVLIISILHGIAAALSVWLGYFKLSSLLINVWERHSDKCINDTPAPDTIPSDSVTEIESPQLPPHTIDFPQPEPPSDSNVSHQEHSPKAKKRIRPQAVLCILLFIVSIILCAGNVYQSNRYNKDISALRDEIDSLNATIEDQANKLELAKNQNKANYDTGHKRGYTSGSSDGYADGYSSGYWAAVLDYADPDTKESFLISLLTISQTHEDEVEAHAAAYKWVKAWRQSHFGR